MIVVWLALVVLGIGAMAWGSSRAADLLEAVRDKYALPPTAAGALLGLATAAPEISVNVASVAFGWPDLGLGAALGSNVPAIPLAVILIYAAARTAPATSDAPAGETRVAAPQTVEVQVLPYLGVLVLLAVLTLTPGWFGVEPGLQPVDAAILVGAWALFFGRAMLRRDWRETGAQMARGLVGRSLGFGLPAIAAGALASVIGAQKVGSALGWPDLIVGLFLIGFLCALPEAMSAWRFSRENKPTVAVSAATGDGIVSLTFALVPPALVGATVGNVAVYATNLGYLVIVLVLYALTNRGRAGRPIDGRFAALIGGSYVVYALAMAVVLTRPGAT